MKSFTPSQLERSVPMGLTWLVGRVMEARGRQQLYEHQRPEVLTTLRQAALIESAESSNRIEGVTVARERLAPLVLGNTKPKDRSEEEVVGYRLALSWIHDDHDTIPINQATFEGLHHRAQSGSGDAGQLKGVENDIYEVQPDGRRRVRFRTVSVADTPEYVEQLCLGYDHCVQQSALPPVLAVASLAFDFLCIHPFRDGNGRVARLLSLLGLYHHGFDVGRYISLERIIEASRDEYYEALAESSVGWFDAEHDLVPWWSYFLSVINRAYQELETRANELDGGRGAKTETIESIVAGLPSSFTFSDVAQRAPHVSRGQIRKVLRALRDAGELTSEGTGRGARWIKKGGTRS